MRKMSLNVKIVFFNFLLAVVCGSGAYAQDASGTVTKLKTGLDNGTANLKGLVESGIKIAMAITAFAFIVGISGAAYKYMTSDQQAFKSVSNNVWGLLVFFIGLSLVNFLFFA